MERRRGKREEEQGRQRERGRGEREAVRKSLTVGHERIGSIQTQS
mgnify:CR=1 FL=1